ncbi:protein PAIR1 isoform X1 [Triticum aestivum]|uniref:protein PAIR1 isoform X1 n=1 Tax=Triticum aestivum TaxID=4565 RepID=UPI001D00675B|nr:protein PAIR1-like isoform X1 [Triticum aestivum]
MKLKINKACDLASISVLPPRRTRGSSGGGGGGGTSAPAAASAAQQQRSQSMSQKSFSQGIGASFSQGIGSGGASFSQGSGGGGAAFSQGGGGGGAAFSQGGGGGGAAFSQSGGGGGTAFSQVGGGGGAAFSQGGGGGGASFSQGGGSASLLHAQSQLSQASLDESLLSLLSQAPARDQRFAMQEDPSKRMSSYLASSASSCMRDESQLQLAKIPTNPIHRWSPSFLDSRCQVNEDVERKFLHLASSVQKMGMILDSVQNDVMQLNRGMKEASLDSGSIQKKFVLLEDSLKQILKGQDDLKALLKGSTKSNPDQLGILTRKLDEISSILSVLPKQVQTEFEQFKGDIFRFFTKEMEGVVRAVRSLDSRLPGVMQMLADQSCTTNAKPLMNHTAAENESPLMNQTQVAEGSPLMNQGPVADRRPQKKPTAVANGRPKRKNQTAVANGRPQRKNQAAGANWRPHRKKPTEIAANSRPQRHLTRVANGRPQVKQTEAADGRSQTNQKPEANGKALIPVTKPIPVPVVYHRKAVDLKPRVEQWMVPKLAGPSYSRPAPPKEQELAIQKVNTEAPINKMQATLGILIDSDDDGDYEGADSDWSASCVILKLEAGRGCPGDEVVAEEATSEGEGEALEILRRARKRRRREANANANATVLVQDQR